MSFTTLPNEKPTLGEAQILSHGPMSVVVGYEITAFAWSQGRT